jgi:hypothetical protein
MTPLPLVLSAPPSTSPATLMVPPLAEIVAPVLVIVPSSSVVVRVPPV